MRLLIIIFVVLLIIGVSSYFLLKSYSDKIDFDYKITKFDLSDILSGKLTLFLKLLIKNGTPISITVSGIEFGLYYKNKLLAKTGSPSGVSVIDKNTTSPIDNFELEIFASEEAIEVANKYRKKKPIDFEIRDFKMKLFWFKFPISMKKPIPYTYNSYE